MEQRSISTNTRRDYIMGTEKTIKLFLENDQIRANTNRSYLNELKEIETVLRSFENGVDTSGFWDEFLIKNRVLQGAVKKFIQLSPEAFVASVLALRGLNVIYSTHTHCEFRKGLHGLVSALTDKKNVVIKSHTKQQAYATHRLMTSKIDGARKEASEELDDRLNRITYKKIGDGGKSGIDVMTHFPITAKQIDRVVDEFKTPRQKFAHITPTIMTDTKDLDKVRKTLEENFYVFDMYEDMAIAPTTLKRKIKREGKLGVLIRGNEGLEMTTYVLGTLLVNGLVEDEMLELI